MKAPWSVATSSLSWTKAGEAVAAELYDDVALTTVTNTCFILTSSGNIVENACSDALPFICKSGQLSFCLFVHLSKAPFIPVTLLASYDCFAIKWVLNPIGKSITKHSQELENLLKITSLNGAWWPVYISIAIVYMYKSFEEAPIVSLLL